MHVTQTEFSIVPDAADDLRRALKLYRRETLKEPGVLRCDLLHDTVDRFSFVLYEAFLDVKSFDAHDRTKHRSNFRERLEGMALRPPLVRKMDSVIGEIAPSRKREEKPAWETIANARAQRKKGDPIVWVRATIHRIEFAAATEGPLRGLPDPTLVLALYEVQDSDEVTPVLIGRLLWRVSMTQEAPYMTKPEEAVLEAPCGIRVLPARILVVLVGVEENGGDGVQQVYQRLEDTRSLMLNKTSHDMPAPLGIAEFCATEAPAVQGAEVLLIAGETPLSDCMEEDTWVGASAAVVELQPARLNALQKFRLATDPAVNDWRASISLSVDTARSTPARPR